MLSRDDVVEATGKMTNRQGWLAVVAVFVLCGGVFVADAVGGSAGNWLYLLTVVLVIATPWIFSLGFRMVRKPPSKLVSTVIPAALCAPVAEAESVDGSAERIESEIRVPPGNQGMCLAYSVHAGTAPDAIFVRARGGVELAIATGDNRVVVTGTVWLLPNATTRPMPYLAPWLGLPPQIDVGAEVLGTVLRAGDRVRVYGTPEIEAHRIFATYRDATGPVLRGRPGAPVIIEKLG